MDASRAGFGQKLLWRLEVLGFDIACAFFRMLPVDTASDVGAVLVRTLGPLTGVRKIVDRNIRVAFPEMNEAERAALMRAQWEHLGRYFAEFMMYDRLTSASGRIEVIGAERLAAIAKDSIPTVFVSGHLSNFEIMAAVILDAGVRCQVTYSAANNPYFDARMLRSRRQYGASLFAPKGTDGSRELLQAMNRGESVALMNDQKFNRGVAAPFFGHLAHTASGPTRLALRGNGILQPLSVQRIKVARFRVVVHEPIVLERTNDRAADLEAGVRQVNAFVEARVRERPEEWWWTHKRWADEVYAAL